MSENICIDDFKTQLEAYFAKNRASNQFDVPELNLDTKPVEEEQEQQEYEIDFSKNPLKRIAINKFGIFNRVESYYMLYPVNNEFYQDLLKIQKQLLDNPKATARFQLDDGISVLFDDVKMFGKFDFDNPDDIAKIQHFLAKDNFECHFIPREFDYDTCISKSKGKFIQWTESTDYLKCFKYYHARIGKPTFYLIVRLTPNAIAKS